MFAPSPDFLTSRGVWHVYEMAIDPGTPNQVDGTQTFWVDGEKVYTATGIAWRTTSELKPNQVGVYLYIHYNPANTTNILDVDNVVLSRQYIGPAPCHDGVEIEAACLCGGTPDPDDGSNAYTSGYCCAGAWQAASCGPTPDGGLGPDAASPGDGGSQPGADAAATGDGGQGGGGSGDGGCGCRGAARGPSNLPTFVLFVVFLLFLGMAVHRRR